MLRPPPATPPTATTSANAPRPGLDQPGRPAIYRRGHARPGRAVRCGGGSKGVRRGPRDRGRQVVVRLTGIVAGGVLAPAILSSRRALGPKGGSTRSTAAPGSASGESTWASCPPRSPWSARCSWWRTSGASCSRLDPKTGARHWRRQLGDLIAPMPVDSGDVVVATPDSLFRIATTDGAVRRRVRAPGAVVSPWIWMHGSLVAGRRTRLVVAIDPDSLTPLEGAAGRPGHGQPRRHGRHHLRGYPPGHALPGDSRHARQGGRIVELDWPITAPVTIVHRQILLGGADGPSGPSTPAERSTGASTCGARSSWPPAAGRRYGGGRRHGDLHRYRR